MYGIVVLFVLSTVQSYGKMKYSPRRMNYSEIITNFAPHYRLKHLTGKEKRPFSRKNILS